MRADRVRTALLGGAAALALAGCASSTPGEGGWYGTPLADPNPAPAVELTDLDGAKVSLADPSEPLTLVFFGYTNCPDICSQEMQDITSALQRLPESARDDVEVVFVTTDPARDDAEALERYLAPFDAGTSSYVGLTGSLADLQTAAGAFGVSAGVEGKDGTPVPLDSVGELGTDYMVAHTDYTFAVNREGEIPVIWNRDVTPKGLAEDIARLLEEDA